MAAAAQEARFNRRHESRRIGNTFLLGALAIVAVWSFTALSWGFKLGYSVRLLLPAVLLFAAAFRGYQCATIIASRDGLRLRNFAPSSFTPWRDVESVTLAEATIRRRLGHVIAVDRVDGSRVMAFEFFDPANPVTTVAHPTCQEVIEELRHYRQHLS